MSDFIIAESGEHWACNPLGRSAVLQQGHFLLRTFSCLGSSFIIGNCSCPLRPVLSSLLCGFLFFFLSLDCWASDFILSWTVSSDCHLKCTFLSSLSSSFHMSPTVHHRPLQFHMPEWNSSPVGLISVGITQCPGQEPQRRPWLAVSFTHLVQLVTKTWWWHLLNISLVLSTLLLPCLTPSFPIQTSKTTYQ